MSGHTESEVLMWARLASSEGGLDTVDAAVRTAASRFAFEVVPARYEFIPFDPSTKMAEANVTDEQGTKQRVMKGAFAYVLANAEASKEANAKQPSPNARFWFMVCL
jgi:H+-transporting ATPase